jgi:hypothetical protein
LLRIAHLSPDTPAADVAVAGATITGVGYGTVTAYREIPAGRYTVAVRAAGAATDTPPVLTDVVHVPAGGARTLTLSGGFADLGLAVLVDDLTPPPPGSTRVRVVAAADRGPLDVAIGDREVATALPFGGVGPYAAVPAGRSAVQVSAGGSPPIPVTLDLAAGSVVSLVVLDRSGGLGVLPVVDAAAPSVVPSGPVEAGGGPPAGPPPGMTPTAAPEAGIAPTAAAVAPPVRVRIPTVGIDGPLRGVGLDATGALVPPSDVGTAGWFRGGPVPGETGPAVLAGHVDGGGVPGLFARLGEVVVGDAVLVEGADGRTHRFTVTAVNRYPKSAFPTAEVYGTAVGPELRLITCGGAFDATRRSYADNVVVRARAES